MTAISASHYATAGIRPTVKNHAASVRLHLAQLIQAAHQHRALHHPYLKALAAGAVPNLRWAITDFARQYHGYSVYFPCFLNAVICRLDDPAHQEALLQNLSEESGIYPEEDLADLATVGIEADWIVGVPHPQLFQRFQTALGIERTELNQPDPEVIQWRHQLLMFLTNGSAAEAIGAIGLGTESIVSTCYQPILDAIAQLEDITARDAVFFTMHTVVDDAHQETLLDIATDLAQTPQGRRDLRKGMNKALTLRAKFWDWMYHRALTQEKLVA